ncbi:hypothetical protein HYC85_027008 [Camellia sinensis]|uniref:Auxin-responsive protein n=1 Tax=Camellia sinensis TaxID=4442 RepID=A0A7J7G5A2_CAMSI|nr:hypothetical protein HYC85_027008 [Camellia sinensis]
MIVTRGRTNRGPKNQNHPKSQTHARNDMEQSQPYFTRRVETRMKKSKQTKLSPEMEKKSPESDVAGLNLKETELTLGLPGESRNQKSGTKRGFSKRVDDDRYLNLGSSGGGVESGSDKNCEDDQSENDVSQATKPSTAKAQVVGWPPVRSFRKNMMTTTTMTTTTTKTASKYVKVAVDGAPYLRKVDLEMHSSYEQLLTALEDMFTCFTIRNYLNERKLMDTVNGSEYVPTYEDKDGDWMLVGDVPWKMFVESCKRLRLMKSSEAIGLAPRTPTKCSSTSY